MLDTSASLLANLRERPDPQGWNRLVELYTPLIQAWLRRHFLQPHDVDDLAQDVLAKLVSELPAFEYDRSKGHFRGWLRGIVVNRLRIFWRTRNPKPVGAETDGPNMIDQLADPESDLSQLWNREHDAMVTRKFLELVESEFGKAQVQAFRRVVLEEADAAEVAKELGLSRSAVYTAKSRILNRLRQELEGILD